ncbi:MAG: DUF4845 domain-containing protein [Gammaproteobacteria bacterium]|nr:DUF4845 domain-containing protein [Gammaproteobacteria bacterium]MBT8444871.1 DUF4845 domain-containing protein [Gammaproteobacteria bacterium]NND37203.1 DUF4845 domain-containing protein [Gammaproteobacteria bacterium]
MRDRQRGMTLISLAIVVAFVASYGFAVLKVTPFYLEQIKIKRVLTDVEANLSGNNASVMQVRDAIDKRLNIEMVRDLRAKDFSIKKGGSGYIVNAAYERRASYFGNLYLVVAFDETVEIRR